MMSRHFNDPNADAYFTKRKWGKEKRQASCMLTNGFALWEGSLYFKIHEILSL